MGLSLSIKSLKEISSFLSFFQIHTISEDLAWSKILLHMELATRSLAFKFGRVLSHCALTLSISPLSSSVTVSKILNTLSTSRSPLFSSNSLTKCLISPCKKGRWLNNLSYRSSLITYLVVFCKRKYSVKFILVLTFRLCITIT